MSLYLCAKDRHGKHQTRRLVAFGGDPDKTVAVICTKCGETLFDHADDQGEVPFPQLQKD